MKNRILILSLALLCPGCAMLSPAQKAAIVSAAENPNNIAAAVQKGTQAGATAILAKNPSYAPDVAAVADVLLAVAQSNPTDIAPTDISGALAKTSISASIQGDINAVIASALGSYKTSWNANLPTVSPDIALFLKAAANGLNESLGKPGVPLPVVQWPPAASSAPAAPAS
jgi:hypothetical protein